MSHRPHVFLMCDVLVQRLGDGRYAMGSAFICEAMRGRARGSQLSLVTAHSDYGTVRRLFAETAVRGMLARCARICVHTYHIGGLVPGEASAPGPWPPPSCERCRSQDCRDPPGDPRTSAFNQSATSPPFGSTRCCGPSAWSACSSSPPSPTPRQCTRLRPHQVARFALPGTIADPSFSTSLHAHVAFVAPFSGPREPARVRDQPGVVVAGLWRPALLAQHARRDARSSPGPRPAGARQLRRGARPRLRRLLAQAPDELALAQEDEEAFRAPGGPRPCRSPTVIRDLHRVAGAPYAGACGAAGDG